MATWHNWARNEHSSPHRFDTPENTGELATVVARAAEQGRRVKAVGAGHSFTGVAVTDGVLLSLDRMTGIETVLPTATGALVRVQAGTRLHDLSDQLWALGLALPNLGDIDVQSVAGAISTGTHGTGASFTGLAAQVRAVTTVLTDGSVVECSPDHEPELFEVSRLGIGAFGVLSSVTFDCVSAFRLRAHEAPASLSETLDSLDERLHADHFEFYWFPHTEGVLTKTNTRLPGAAPVDPVGRVRGFVDDEILSNGVFNAFQHLGTRVPSLVPGLNSLSSRALAERTYTDRSHRVFASKRRVRFKEMEYAIPVDALPTVLDEIATWLNRSDVRIGFPIEVRFAAADDVWLSTAHQRDTAYVAVHQFHRGEHREYFSAVEAIAQSVGGRPHWGKLHGLTAAELSRAYPRFDDVLAVRDRVDPQRVFGNAYLQRVLGA
ncbi:D-arabinono-1,4-lactone oxidase [Rhodococcus artemisiae]|uniref:D-arabinono-1,4-lactone oxidase n=1 Tax=Rhodococcus artemisiae TaxID=714159 RepID=A0ABU7LI05_9NOCA|nr:D-arabinono-1,4-lactone oxidase [Rhodococcus artemisiae]MEE2061185.1 D-arabinono-1,4-lactone oxidase [Rhodococcus artemisiae]